MEEQEEEVGRSIYIYPHGGRLELAVCGVVTSGSGRGAAAAAQCTAREQH